MKEDKIVNFIKKNLKVLHIKLSKKHEELLIQIFKFGIVGGIATVIDFLCIYIFKEVFNIPVIISNTLSFIIATIYNYIASVKWVFNVNQDKSASRNFIIFVIFSVIGLLLNDLIVWFTIDKFNMYYLLGKLFATCFVMIFNFITRKLFLE